MGRREDPTPATTNSKIRRKNGRSPVVWIHEEPGEWVLDCLDDLDPPSSDLENAHAPRRISSPSDGCSNTHHDDGRQVDGSPRDSNVQTHNIGEGNASCGESSHANPNHVVMTGSHLQGNSVFYFNPGEKKSQKGKRFKHAPRSKGSPSPTMPRPKKRARPDDDPFGLNKLLGLSMDSEPPPFIFSFPPSVLIPRS
ncbi:hypothetical protein L1987_37134 [Smallanthus sonchifolius]|uniref:Uncharacterized protein n=1 Tax=Smallanthus sonchifolius TaxID=185202 RepID=A0ACB9HI25_9ASTR|nr:hypothetical protein L1987_37134 [Smallanthus sonchifolius]